MDRLFGDLVSGIRMLVRYPLMTAKVTTLIHLQGLRLHRRGVAHVKHRRRRPQEGVG